MIVLGFDTSTRATSVALQLHDGTSLQALDDPAAGEHPGHATRLLQMSHELLGRAGIGWQEIDRIAAGLGPGTFTGLRVGVASARGLAQSLGCELVGVSSLRALAVAGLAADRAPGSEEGPVPTVLAVIDARRGEAFAAAYEPGGDAGPVELTVAEALAPQELGGVLKRVAAPRAERGRRWVALGDGAVRFRGQLEAAGVGSPPEESPLHVVSAAAICELGGRVSEVLGNQQILPDYRRRPDAELLARAGAPGVGR